MNRKEKLTSILKQALYIPGKPGEMPSGMPNLPQTIGDTYNDTVDSLLQQLKELREAGNISTTEIKNLFSDAQEALPDVSVSEIKNLFRDALPSTLTPKTPKTPKPSSERSAPSNEGVIRYGEKSDRVRDLQQKLYEKGYRVSLRGSGPDGSFGKNTKNAIIYFQVLNDIHPANGAVNSETLSKINSAQSIGPNDTVDRPPKAEKLEYTDADVEAAARGLVVETGFRADYNEMAGIVWIMINRSRKWNMSIRDVIHPDTGGGKNWYGGLSPNNRKRWDAAHKRRDFSYIKNFVKKIFDGVSFENPIGNRAHFLHPGGMPRCSGEPGSPCGSRNHRICVDTGKWGKRCLPKWNIEGNRNMTGKVQVETIGAARFS